MSEVGGKTLTIGEFFREPFFVVVSVFVWWDSTVSSH
jgi:hypothetical protein